MDMPPSLSGKTDRRFQARFPAYLPPLLALASGLLVSAIAFLGMQRYERHMEDAGFEQRANIYAAAVRNEAQYALQALQGITRLFEAPDLACGRHFHAFAQPLLERFPYIQSLSFQRIVSKDERPAFELRMRKRHPDFEVAEIRKGRRSPAEIRDSYRVVEHLEPMTGNEAIFGLDVASLGWNADGASRPAGGIGSASATGLFRIGTASAAQRGFAVSVPVYRKDPAPANASAVSPQAAGYTVAVFRADSLVEKALSAAELPHASGLGISVYAGSRTDERNLVFRTEAEAPAAKRLLVLSDWLFHDRPRTVSRSFDVGGRIWQMDISARPMPFPAHHPASLLVLFGGVLFSLLTAAYLRRTGSRSQHTRQLVDQRTAELEVVNQSLIEDIAARKEVERELRHTQHVLTNAQNVAHLGSWEFNAKTSKLQCSDEFFRICGLAPRSIKPDLEFALSIIHPDDIEASKKAIAMTAEEGKPYRIEKRIVRPDGSIRYVISRGEAIYDDAHELQRVEGSFLDITEQKQTELALRQSEEKLRELAAHLERIKEEERKRIAREVHDELGGLLTGIKAYLSVAINRETSAGRAPDKLLTDAAELADVATETVRRVIVELRPSVLDQLGVWAAIEWHVSQIEERSGLCCICEISEAAAAVQLEPDHSTMLFRIVQEALTNVVRHADASRIMVRATHRDGAIVIEIEDDGVGIDTEHLLGSDSWGIVGMYERARYFGGELDITGMPGRGTLVVLRLPLETKHG
jgi:PAS domain S-box-containing protein